MKQEEVVQPGAAQTMPPASAASPAGTSEDDAALRAAIAEMREVQVCGTDECNAPDQQCAACWRDTSERNRHAITLQKLLFTRLRASAPASRGLTDEERAMLARIKMRQADRDVGPFDGSDAEDAHRDCAALLALVRRLSAPSAPPADTPNAENEDA